MPAADRPQRRPRPLAITVVVPARNAEGWIESCLRAVRRNQPAEVILVDGQSTDRTVERARALVDRVIDDGGNGVAAARQMGAEAASQPWIVFVDVDVVLPDDALRELTLEAMSRGLPALQAALRSEGAGEYWSNALADHHNRGRSREWFGVSATLVERELIVAHPFDVRFGSGEDVDLRLRLRAAGVAVGVSERTVVRHRFGPGARFARAQWLADGAGLGRLIRRHGRPALLPAVIPFAAGALGAARSLRDRLRPLPYFAGFVAGNFVGLARGLRDRRISVETNARRALIVASLVALGALPLLAVGAAAAAALVAKAAASAFVAASYDGSAVAAITAAAAAGSLGSWEVAKSGQTESARLWARRLGPFAAVLTSLGLLATVTRLVNVLT